MTTTTAPTIERDSVRVWCDGYGLWHAHVAFPSHGYGNTGPLSLDAHWDRIRALARRTIRREIVAREQRTGETRAQTSARIVPTRIQVEAQGIHPSTNVWYSVTFRERT